MLRLRLLTQATLSTNGFYELNFSANRDEPYRLPDIHIFTSTMQPWIVLSAQIPAMAEYYDRNQHWPAASLARREAMLAATSGKA